MAKRTTGLPPGSRAPKSGQYQQVGPRGGKGPERTVVRGEPLPADPQTGDALYLGRSDQDVLMVQDHPRRAHVRRGVLLGRRK